MPRSSARRNTDFALRDAGWNEDEARARIKELLSRGWGIEAIAKLFGLSVTETLTVAAPPKADRRRWMH